MSIPQSFIQELLARTDVVEVVGRYVQLKKGGANFMGLCPFHGEKSPSFSVSPSKQFYHCFGCGANGNAISFLIEHAGMNFVEAVQDLAQQTGLQVPQDDASPQDRVRAQQQKQQQQSLTEVLELASRAYQKQLKTSPRAVAYLKGRGLSGEVAKTFALGYAPAGWRALASLLPDYSDRRLVESGLVIASEDSNPHESNGQPDTTALPDTAGATDPAVSRESKRYDRFRDRIMFPIRNVKGETIGFGGRVLDQGEPKYLNSPETPVFSKGHELYGLFEARTAIRVAGYALVTEGYMDVVALAQLGFANAVATLGTACTAEHVQKLFRFTDAVIFSFDGDAAGRRAAAKALVASLPHAQDTRNIKFLFLPPEHDPDSYIRAHGTDAFAQCVKDAMPLSRFMLETAAAQCDLDQAEGRALLASHARPMWMSLPEGALKRQLLSDLARQIGLAVPELSGLWEQQAHGDKRRAVHGERYTSAPQSRRYSADESDASGTTPPFRGQPRPWSASRGTPPNAARSRSGANRGGTHLASRGDHVARLMLSHPQAWDWLTPADHHLLSEQPPPLGPLFAWLEGQWHEHGPQPWAVMQQALKGQQTFESHANHLMGQALSLSAPAPEADAPDESGHGDADARRELLELLQRMWIELLKTQETEAIAQASHDPAALQTYRELQGRRRALEQALDAAPKMVS